MRAFAAAVLLLVVLTPTGLAKHQCLAVPGGMACVLSEDVYRTPLLVYTQQGGALLLVYNQEDSVGDAHAMHASAAAIAPAGGAVLSLWQWSYTLAGIHTQVTWGFGGSAAGSSWAEPEYLQIVRGSTCTEELTLSTSATGPLHSGPGACVAPMPDLAQAEGRALDLL